MLGSWGVSRDIFRAISVTVMFGQTKPTLDTEACLHSSVGTRWHVP
jgi:hypothetical protein